MKVNSLAIRLYKGLINMMESLSHTELHQQDVCLGHKFKKKQQAQSQAKSQIVCLTARLWPQE